LLWDIPFVTRQAFIRPKRQKKTGEKIMSKKNRPLQFSGALEILKFEKIKSTFEGTKAKGVKKEQI